MKTRKGIADRAIRKFVLLSGVAVGLEGCGPQRHALVAVTATSIGVEIAQNPANQTPHAKLGYQRQEVAVVPTNRSANEEVGNGGGGAASHGEVLMELRYGGIFDMGPSSGIYQRLAVGPTAVRQPGAWLMFSRDADGTVSDEAQQVLANLKKVPTISATTGDIIDRIIAARVCHQKEVDAAIQQAGVSRFEDVRDGKATAAQLAQIEAMVATLSVCS